MDKEEFARRTEAIRNRLYRAAYLMVGSEADALEAVDEAVYQALRSLRGLREDAFFETWLTRILLNEALQTKQSRITAKRSRSGSTATTSAKLCMAGLTELRFKADRPHKGFIILLPHRLAVQAAAQNDALHIVRQ
ncbi:sigma factor, partial [Oscillibacter sp.]|uniref:sigma factor n=1 Tax=Oscillibacter sp. TaxID=1945593 RepID=UPI00262A870B